MASAPSKRGGRRADARGLEPGQNRSGQTLSDDDKALWDAVAKTVRRRLSNAPIDDDRPAGARPKANGMSNGSTQPPEPPASKPPATAPIALRAFEGRPEPKTSVRRAPAPAKLGPSTPGLDRRTAERLRKGKVDPDARLDLHGMTSARAHGALTSFVMREQAAGSRCVLVITGKGGRKVDPSHGWRDLGPGEGVLKNLTPQWLAQPPLSDLVIGVYPAHISHGGAGALYVYLRKRR